MKGKPVFKNVTKNRIQIIRQGIPHWLWPGDTIVGERYRVYVKMGLKEVGRQTSIVGPTKPAPEPLLVIDGTLEASPVTVITTAPDELDEPDAPEAPEEPKVKEIVLIDDVIPVDDLILGSASKEPTQATGEALKDEIMAEIEAELAAEMPEVVEESDEEPIIILDDVEEGVADNYPYKCEIEGCDRAFASERGLKSHSRVHK